MPPSRPPHADPAAALPEASMRAPQRARRGRTGRLVVRSGADGALRSALADFLAEDALDRLPPLALGRHSRVARVRLAGRALVVKRYVHPALFRAPTFLRASRAEREGRALEALATRAGNPVRPIAWAEERRFGLVRRCHLVTEELEGAEDLKRLAARGALAERSSLRATLLEDLPRRVAALHAAGFFAKRLHAKNVLVQPGSGRLAWIDLRPGRRRWRRVTLRARVYDLASLHKGLRGALGPEGWRDFLERYWEAAGLAARVGAEALERRVERRAEALAHRTRFAAARRRLRRRLARTRPGAALTGRRR